MLEALHEEEQASEWKLQSAQEAHAQNAELLDSDSCHANGRHVRPKLSTEMSFDSRT